MHQTRNLHFLSWWWLKKDLLQLSYPWLYTTLSMEMVFYFHSPINNYVYVDPSCPFISKVFDGSKISDWQEEGFFLSIRDFGIVPSSTFSQFQWMWFTILRYLIMSFFKFLPFSLRRKSGLELIWHRGNYLDRMVNMCMITIVISWPSLSSFFVNMSIDLKWRIRIMPVVIASYISFV